MSGFGFRGPAGNTNIGAMSSGGAPDRGIAGSQRDAWNNPIEVPKEKPAPRADADGNPIVDKNNDGIDDETIDNIWNEVKKENSKTGNEPPNNQQPTPQVDQKKQLDDYLASQGLEPIVLSEAQKEKLKNGDFDEVLLMISGKVQQAHVKGLSSTKTMIEAAVKDAVAAAVGQSRSDASGRENLNALHTALPFTKDRAIGPVAQSVMQRFLDRKMSTEDAIKGVKKFFDHTAEQVHGSPVNRNRNGNYSGARNEGSDNEGSGNWLETLSPGN